MEVGSEESSQTLNLDDSDEIIVETLRDDEPDTYQAAHISGGYSIRRNEDHAVVIHCHEADTCLYENFSMYNISNVAKRSPTPRQIPSESRQNPQRIRPQTRRPTAKKSQITKGPPRQNARTSGAAESPTPSVNPPEALTLTRSGSRERQRFKLSPSPSTQDIRPASLQGPSLFSPDHDLQLLSLSIYERQSCDSRPSAETSEKHRMENRDDFSYIRDLSRHETKVFKFMAACDQRRQRQESQTSHKKSFSVIALRPRRSIRSISLRHLGRRQTDIEKLTLWMKKLIFKRASSKSRDFDFSKVMSTFSSFSSRKSKSAQESCEGEEESVGEPLKKYEQVLVDNMKNVCLAKGIRKEDWEEVGRETMNHVTEIQAMIKEMADGKAPTDSRPSVSIKEMKNYHSIMLAAGFIPLESLTGLSEMIDALLVYGEEDDRYSTDSRMDMALTNAEAICGVVEKLIHHGGCAAGFPEDELLLIDGLLAMKADLDFGREDKPDEQIAKDFEPHIAYAMLTIELEDLLRKAIIVVAILLYVYFKRYFYEFALTPNNIKNEGQVDIYVDFMQYENRYDYTRILPIWNREDRPQQYVFSDETFTNIYRKNILYDTFYDYRKFVEF